MRLLLDTHAFLWFILDDSQVSTIAKQLIANPDNIIEVSPASYWEIAIKISLGKYALPEPLLPSWSGKLRLTTSMFYRLNPGIPQY